VFGLTAALQGRIEFIRGVATAENFHQYPVARMGEVPTIEVYLVPSQEPPSGCGEPATPVVAPALCNAILAATGLARYRLPLLDS
jgi:isoquinoline 1-oxidoreductase beta subunit